MTDTSLEAFRNLSQQLKPYNVGILIEVVDAGRRTTVEGTYNSLSRTVKAKNIAVPIYELPKWFKLFFALSVVDIHFKKNGGRV